MQCSAQGPSERRTTIVLQQQFKRRCRSIAEYRNLYDFRMKTTLDINAQLLTEAKVLAAQQRTSLTRVNWSPKNGRHEVCYFDFLEDI